MKKLISIILSIALILTAAAAVAEGNDSLNEIKTRGYLIVGTEGTWSPYTFFIHPRQKRTIDFLRRTKWKPEGELLSDEGVI